MEDKIAVANGNSNILSWSGDEGNSKRIPKDSSGEIAKELEKYGVDGIEYRDGDVDFSPVSQFQVDFDDTDQLYVDVANSITMGDLKKKDGSSKNRSEFNSVVREKWQKLAKQQLVERIQSEPGFAADLQKRTGIDAGSVKSVTGLENELSRVGLTLHETPDCTSIQFVPTKIHSTFKHSGGTSEMLERLIDGDTHGRIDQKIEEGILRKNEYVTF